MHRSRLLVLVATGALAIAGRAGGQPSEECLTLVRTVEVGRTPSFVAFAPRSGDLFVSCAYDTAIRRLSAEQHESTAWWRMSPVSPYGFVLTKDERQIVLANFAGDQLCWLDLADGELTHRVTLEQKPCMLALTPDGQSVIVACDRAQSLFRVSLSRQETEGSPVVLSGAPHGLAFHPKGTPLYVTTGAPTPGFAAVHWKSGTHDTFELEVLPQSDVAVSAKGDHLYLASAREGGGLLVVDARRLRPPEPPTVLREIALGDPAPSFVLVRKDRSLAALLPARNELVLLDLRKGEVQQRIATGERPQHVAVSRDGATLAVANRGSRNVSIYAIER